MRWKGRRQSDNVEDRRGSGGGGFPFPFPGRGRGGGTRFPMPRGSGGRRGGGMSLVTMLIIVGIMIFFPEFGKMLLGGITGGGGGGGGIQIPMPRQITPNSPFGQETTSRSSKTIDDQMGKFISVVLADTEDIWRNQFRKIGKSYREPKLVLFSNHTRTACGPGMQMMGPFYCPLDQKVYIDLAFYKQLKNKFGAGGDFAQAYVVAHEVGHHIQTLLGVTEKVQRAKARSGKRRANQIQVMMELQADCYAGLWARNADRSKEILEQGDIEEAMNAAKAIGDDQIQRRTTGRINPESFTHGSSKQRMRWFKRGFNSGKMTSCDTFNSGQL